jgi:hypothetical protein
MAATYGPHVLGPDLPFLTYYQLWLNRDRQSLRRSWEIKRGLEAAHSRQDLPLAYAEAVTDGPLEAEDLLFRENAARSFQAKLDQIR